MKTTLLDRAIGYLAPAWALSRARARVANDLVVRSSYDAASVGRRTSGWRMSAGDANAAVGWDLKRLREAARDLVRNNPHAASAVSTIQDHTVGWGIVAKPKSPMAQPALDAWKAWADSPLCDADGREDLYGLQKLALRTVVESGECLVRRRLRVRQEDLDTLPIPMQLQVLEPDYLDTSKTEVTPGGGRIVHGVEFDAIGRRRGYWLFQEHPGSQNFGTAAVSRFVPAEGVLHLFRRDRPQQVRGASWFAPVTMALADYGDYVDAQQVKQRVAACLAVITTDTTGSGTPLGATSTAQPTWDYLEPGIIHNAAPGQDVTVVQPPRVEGFGEYAEVTLRAIAAGLGITYEDLTGDYTELPFSAARMSRIRHWSRVNDWRWRLLVPQFCDPVWFWALDLMRVTGLLRAGAAPLPMADWTAPPMPMIEPDKEGLAYQRNIRNGIQSHSEVLRELGYDPDSVRKELAADFKELDRLELVLDIDPRKMTQAGQAQADPKEDAPSPPPAPAGGGGDARAMRHALEQLGGVAKGATDALAAMALKPAAPVNVNHIIQRGAIQTTLQRLFEPGAIAVPVEIHHHGPDPELVKEVAALGDEERDGLTDRQREVLHQIRSYREEFGKFPTISHIARRLKISRATLRGHLEALVEKKALRTATPAGLPPSDGTP